MSTVKPPTRHVGWSVVSEDGGSSFGTFERRSSADETATLLRKYGNKVRVEEASAVDLHAAVAAFLEVATGLPGLKDAPDRRLVKELHAMTANLVEMGDLPEVGTIAHHRYIGDGEAERDLLSTLLRGMARKASAYRRAYHASIVEASAIRAELRRVQAEVSA